MRSAGSDGPSEEPIVEIDRRHWSFEPLIRPALPPVRESGWCCTPVDRFILARLEQEELQPMPEADRLTLLRRVAFDLTGLPPTLEEIDAFLADEGFGAYERLVDRLLASPAYGERWAQHWLDLARFAETDGFEHDKVRPQAWRYRDWVIDALNADVPYDRFVQLQLAGDELRASDADAHVATGFLLCGPDMPDINLQEERRHVFLNDMTGTVAEVLLALRMGCAQCHDHKTDPISQYDFYRLRAFFDSLDLFRDHPVPNRSSPDQQPLPLRIVHNAAGSRPESRLWIRGDFRRPGPPVEASFPRIVSVSLTAVPDGEHSSPPVSSRSSLAEWITREDNPLTARVIVNRVWQHHFGVGIAATPSDFGIMGDPPTHPELLDWLATEFLEQNWSLKALHRLLVTSAVYRTASRPEVGETAALRSQHDDWSRLHDVDPDNAFLGRARRRRLEGEAIRDAMLSVSGQLNREARGPGIRPPLAPEITSTLLKNQWPVTDDPREYTRRSLYLFVRRNLRYPLFDVFDKPDPNLSCSRRSETTIAPQALHLLNSEFALDCAERLADRISAASNDAREQITICYRLAYGRPPTIEEQAAAQQFLRPGEGEPRTALIDLCLAVFNTNEFVYFD
ncbi:MAG: DUF1549 and DUF1553 domain-containing protein [Planctomycetaceae bacterium]